MNEEGWELNTQDLFLVTFKGIISLFSLIMEKLCTCFSLPQQIICQDKAYLIPCHFFLHYKDSIEVSVC